MPQRTSPFVEGKYGWDLGENNWNLGMDQNMLKFSYLFDRNVDSITDNLPPPINGQAHYLTTDNRLYFVVGGTYLSSPTPKWFIVALKSNGQLYQFNGQSLVEVKNASEIEADLGAIELTLSSLGSAAYQDESYFSTTEQLDLVEATSANYTDQLRNDLAAPDGGDIVGYVVSDSGGVIRTVRERLSDFRSLKDFTTAQEAIDALPEGGCLFLPAGVYDWESEVYLAGKKDITIFGLGAVLRQNGSRFRSFFDCSASSGTIKFYGIEFDQNGSQMPVYNAADYPSVYNCGVYGETCETVVIQNCSFSDLYTRAVMLVGCGALIVDGCRFTSPVQQQDQQIDHVAATTCGRVVITRNSFVNSPVNNSRYVPCGVVVSGIRNQVHIDGNYFDFCGRNNDGTHRLGVIDCYYDVENVTITNNVAENCMAQFMRLSACNGGMISGNTIRVSGFAESSGTLLSVEGYYFEGSPNNGTRNVSVQNNKIYDPFNRCEVAIGVYAYDWGLPSDQVEVASNQFTGVKFAVAVLGPYRKLAIRDNSSRGYLGAISVRPTVTGPGMTSNFGLESSCILDSLTISGNKISNESDIVTAAVLFDSEKTPAFSGQIRELTISDNHLVTLSAKAIPAIFVRSPAADRPDVFVTDNFTRNYQNAVSVSNTAVTRVTGNTARQIPGDFIVDAGGNDVVHRRSNSDGGILAGGPTQGRATLVAGLAVVNTSEVTPGATIAVSRILTGGTLGHLSVESITARTSFAIRSSSSSDVSTVFWELIK